MNFFNRLVMVILLLLGLLLSLFAILVAIELKDAVAALSENVRTLSENVSLGLQILLASAAALVGIACFLILLLEIVPRSAKGVRLTGVTGASAQLTLDAIVNRIRYEVEGVPEVRQVKPSVSAKGTSVDVNLQLYTELTTDIAVKTEEISLIVRDTVEKKLGVKLRKLNVFVRQDISAKQVKKQAAVRQQALAEIKPDEPKIGVTPSEPLTTPFHND
ncbi:MAG: alkaline shock response membrane anchor protein AmaP [Dehalococcoidia bacterium]|nr:alkaline shock response membrane anchor protein AmaP [Dehalococcoidia bacterium]